LTETKRIEIAFNVDPNFYRIYRDDYISELVKSVPIGADRSQKFQFKTTMAELQKMFDGTEELIGILINRVQNRQTYLPRSAIFLLKRI
jgi:hypothetical protein